MKPEEVDKYRRDASGENQYNLPRFFNDPVTYY